MLLSMLLALAHELLTTIKGLAIIIIIILLWQMVKLRLREDK